MGHALTVCLPGSADQTTPVTVAALRGRDEKWLGGLDPATPRESAVIRLLAHRTRIAADTLRDLPVGDRDFLVLKLGEASFGGRVELTFACPRGSCGAVMDTGFDIDDLPVHRSPRQPDYPVPGWGQLRFRLPVAGDLTDPAVVGADDPETALLARCLVGPGADQADDPAVRAAVADEMRRVMPGVPPEMSLWCPECGHEFEAAFDPAAWLLGRIRRGRALLDRDIHLLSFHYHWPLASILALSGPERREYVSLLERQLGLATS
ncbi:hypothetical protein ACN27J_16810 [Solwaraspora sp. WMMB762]|uniref:T4 family baseplate hub assembly chaperone n=1 Tax=Solwaraspora sp. WMMB762 TaxID=3404120 RepID=UPI003B965E13